MNLSTKQGITLPIGGHGLLSIYNLHGGVTCGELEMVARIVGQVMVSVLIDQFWSLLFVFHPLFHIEETAG